MTNPSPSEAKRTELRELALAATPGPWEVEPDRTDLDPNFVPINSPRWGFFASVVVRMDDKLSAEGEANAAFIAAFNPPVALGLLDEVERLRAALTELIRDYVRLMEVGRDRIMDLGGTCDPVDVMEQDDPALIAAKAALQPSGAGKRDPSLGSPDPFDIEHYEGH